jgi:hypothetical protein
MTPAGRLQDYLKQKVQQSGGQYRKVRWEGRRGCPDCFVWWTWPRIAFIEVKAEGDRYSKLQEREVARMQHAGIPVYTVSTIEGIDMILSEIR